ncbi:MAG: hypothetical protein KBG15_05970 [Kofleriaceae bacterium]|nr:hypothetical protein [Kofleriaceae bacterium]
MVTSRAKSLVLRANHDAATGFLQVFGGCTIAAGLMLLLFTQGQSFVVTLGFTVAGVAIVHHARARRRSIDTYTFTSGSNTIQATRTQRNFLFSDVVNIEFDRDWLDVGLVADLHAAYWLVLHMNNGERLCIAHDYRWRLNQLLGELHNLGLQTNLHQPSAPASTGRLIVLPRATARPRQ